MFDTVKNYDLKNVVILNNASLEASLPPWEGAIMNPEDKQNEYNDGHVKMREAADALNFPYL